MDFLRWLFTVNIALFLIERMYFYLLFPKPPSSVELFFMFDRQREEIIKILSEDVSESERLKKFERLLEKHRPNRRINKKK